MHVREFAYVPACEHICHRMRVYIFARLHVSAWLRACECVRMCKRMCFFCSSIYVHVCVHECVCGRVCQSNVCVWVFAYMTRTCACVRVHVHNMC